MFWEFRDLVRSLGDDRRGPKLVALENVVGALSSRGGLDFAALCEALIDAGYMVGAFVVNASDFVPQSRPRLFVVGAHASVPVPRALAGGGPERGWHPSALLDACGKLRPDARRSWMWWRLPVPEGRTCVFADLIEEQPKGVAWHSMAETTKLLGMMNAVNLAKVEAAKKVGHRMVGTVYKRTRPNGPSGEKVQRAEVRFDDVAGCLRTPAGGSSRQAIVLVEGESVRSRLLSPREAARLMGLQDSYILPVNYNDAYHLAGDGVVVPVVRFVAEHLLEPLLAAARTTERQAA